MFGCGVFFIGGMLGMTRGRLNKYLSIAIIGVTIYGAALAAAKLTGREDWFDLLKEGAPLAIGAAAALLANVFQKRSAFVGFLRDEWYNIVETKAALMVFCRRPDKDLDDALEAWAQISTTIDRMRILYRNVGETSSLIGLYPYEPLHDMRRALEKAIGVTDPLADPPNAAAFATADWRAAEREIWKAFQALREVFLEELALTEPDRPILKRGRGRAKKPGAAASAKRRRDRQNAA